MKQTDESDPYIREDITNLMLKWRGVSEEERGDAIMKIMNDHIKRKEKNNML